MSRRSSGEATSQPQLITIAPTRGWASLRLRDLWTHRELLYFLTWRDVKVRYKQTAIGATWAILQPLLMMLIFTVVFSRIARIPTGRVPYPLFAFTALLPWQLFAFALTHGTNSLVASQNLITKAYFPRLIIPLSAVLSGLADFVCGFVVLLGMMLFYGFAPTARLILLPGLLLFAVAAALGVGLWLSALNVKYRDVRHAVPVLTQLWLFVTPIAFPRSAVPDRWRFAVDLNPMTGVVEAFRWMIVKTPTLGAHVGISAVMVLATLVSGAYFFRRVERSFADVI